jgi:hypothetical protein
MAERTAEESHVKRSRLLGSLPFLVALGIAPDAAVEVPLSRASFERALEEGRSCKRIETSSPYIIVKSGSEPWLATIVDDLIESVVSDVVSDSYVTVRLATPYTRVRSAACQANLYGSAFDEAAAWEAARSAETVGFELLTSTLSRTHPPLTVETEDRYGTEPTSVRSAGPRVAGVTLRRGEGDEAELVPAVDTGLEYVVPASALQGAGPFFLVVRTEAPEGRLTLKLKQSVLGKS